MVDEVYARTYSEQYSSVSVMITEEFSGKQLVCAQLKHGETPKGIPQGNGPEWKEGGAWGDNASGLQGKWIKQLWWNKNPYRGVLGKEGKVVGKKGYKG
jgi:hypothetical protein